MICTPRARAASMTGAILCAMASQRRVALRHQCSFHMSQMRMAVSLAGSSFSGVDSCQWQLPHGRPYAFMIMSYNARWDFYQRVKRLTLKEAGLACIRADVVPG